MQQWVILLTIFTINIAFADPCLRLRVSSTLNKSEVELAQELTCLDDYDISKEKCDSCFKKLKKLYRVDNTNNEERHQAAFFQKLEIAFASLTNDIVILNDQLNIPKDKQVELQAACSLDRFESEKVSKCLNKKKTNYSKITSNGKNPITELRENIIEDVIKLKSETPENECSIPNSNVILAMGYANKSKIQKLVDFIKTKEDAVGAYPNIETMLNTLALEDSLPDDIDLLRQELTISSPQVRMILSKSNDISAVSSSLVNIENKTNDIVNQIVNKCNNLFKSTESFLCAKESTNTLRSPTVIESFYSKDERSSTPEKFAHFQDACSGKKTTSFDEVSLNVLQEIPAMYESDIDTSKYYENKNNRIKNNRNMLCNIATPEEKLAESLEKFKCDSDEANQRICPTLLGYQQVIEEQKAIKVKLAELGEDGGDFNQNWLIGSFIGSKASPEQLTMLASIGVQPFSPFVDPTSRNQRVVTDSKNVSPTALVREPEGFLQKSYNDFVGSVKDVIQDSDDETKDTNQKRRTNNRKVASDDTQDFDDVPVDKKKKKRRKRNKKLYDELANRIVNGKKNKSRSIASTSPSTVTNVPSVNNEVSSFSTGSSLLGTGSEKKSETYNAPNVSSKSRSNSPQYKSNSKKASTNRPSNINNAVFVETAETAKIDNMPLYEVVLEGEIADNLTEFDAKNIIEYKSGQKKQLKKLRKALLRSEKQGRPLFLTKIVDDVKYRVIVRKVNGKYTVEKYGVLRKVGGRYVTEDYNSSEFVDDYEEFFDNISLAIKRDVFDKFTSSELARL
jgi:hypothetical protein